MLKLFQTFGTRLIRSQIPLRRFTTEVHDQVEENEKEKRMKMLELEIDVSVLTKLFTIISLSLVSQFTVFSCYVKKV